MKYACRRCEQNTDNPQITLGDRPAQPIEKGMAGPGLLHRIAARTVPDSVLRDPAMVAHARLVVIGSDSARPHKEIIMAGGSLTGDKFKPMNVGEVEEALETGQDAPVSQSMKTSCSSFAGNTSTHCASRSKPA